ncbi:MAG: hypothetical protein ACREAE_08950, partial [Nitrosopumilaceae archaeon]
MLAFIYASGWLYFLFNVAKVYSRRRYDLSERLLLIIVAAVPLGKLVYFNIPLLGGLKFSFVLLVVFLPLLLIRSISRKDFRITRGSLSLLWLFIPALLSLLFLESPERFIFYIVNNEQS